MVYRKGKMEELRAKDEWLREYLRFRPVKSKKQAGNK